MLQQKLNNFRTHLAGRYSLLRDTPLGNGGFGTVFAADDELNLNEVAVKQVRIDGGCNYLSILRELHILRYLFLNIF